MNTGGTVHLHDGQERFDAEEVKKVEKWSNFEMEKKIVKMLRDYETQEWLKVKVRNEKGG
jgi:hypothetical protein